MSSSEQNMVEVEAILRWVEEHFELRSIDDIALNGLQIENSGQVANIVAAVDFSLELINYPAPRDGVVKKRRGVTQSLFLVHHGIFWGKPFPLAGLKYQLLKAMLERDCALLALHLPLDLHPKWGNNVTLAKRLHLKDLRFFGSYKGRQILLAGECDSPTSLDDLIERFKKQVGEMLCVLPYGPKAVQKVGLCTGGGLFGIKAAKEYGCDTYITGDANHTSVGLCRELEINLISGGITIRNSLGCKHWEKS